MEEKELKEKLIKTAKTRGFVCEAPSGKVKDLQLTFNQKELLKLISEELDKAREEGRKYALKEVEYTLAKDERYGFLFTEIKDILSKLTTK